jgi:hypothetical protein
LPKNAVKYYSMRKGLLLSPPSRDPYKIGVEKPDLKKNIDNFSRSYKILLAYREVVPIMKEL